MLLRKAQGIESEAEKRKRISDQLDISLREAQWRQHQRETYRIAFNAFDFDGTGEMDANELLVLLKAFLKPVTVRLLE